ncbi:MAG TPA: hypothetical protein VMW78_09955 [Anaerolineae bacterium]|nr:hypothetical protein [Anaerolineae bacterium]
MTQADKSKVFSWPETGPFQPDPKKFQGKESAGFSQVIIPGEKIMPQTVDPQIKRSGDQ